MSARENQEASSVPHSVPHFGRGALAPTNMMPSFDPCFDPCNDPHIGSALKAERLAKGISLEIASDDLKIQTHYLRALEKLDPQALPSIGYVLGFVRSYAGYLGMDAAWAVNQYKADIAVPKTSGSKILRKEKQGRHAPIRQFRAPRTSMAAGMVLSCLIVVLGWYGFKPDANSAQITIASIPQIAPISTEVQQGSLGIDPKSVVLKAIGPSWVHVENKDGDVLISRIMVPGEIFETSSDEHPFLSLRDAGAIELYRAGRLIGPIGQKGARGKNIPLN